MEVLTVRHKKGFWIESYYDCYDCQGEIEVIASEYEEEGDNHRLVFPSVNHIKIDRSSYPPQIVLGEEVSFMLSNGNKVIGATYQVKEILPSLGYRFDNVNKVWTK